MMLGRPSLPNDGARISVYARALKLRANHMSAPAKFGYQQVWEPDSRIADWLDG